MIPMRSSVVWLCAVLLLPLLSATAANPPRPLADHPGNVFLAGEQVSIAAGGRGPSAWRLLDYEGRVRTNGVSSDGIATLGHLPVGWYELELPVVDGAAGKRLSLAVLQSLPESPSPASPIRLDVGMSWLVPAEKQSAVANLCALAGAGWVRDRFRWSEVEPSAHAFATRVPQDATARIQSAAGLRVLQVHHDTPSWAGPSTSRFALDLRDVFELNRGVALRWRGLVSAFEPWNEADIEVFGGHTGSEMATLQKAAFLGLRAGNREALVCQNVFATPRRSGLEDYVANLPWAYFDTFNFHHYLEPDAYAQTYAEFRAVSGGRSLWITECGQSLHWEGDKNARELSPAAQRIQAERVARLFATAIHEGAAGVFYFLLPHYAEGQNQFGLLRADLTPRPAYAALAAAGRFLCEAQGLGRVKAEASVRAFLFEAHPDGREREVLVAWSTNAMSSLELPLTPEAVFDHLGRPVDGVSRKLILSPSARFVVLPVGSASRFPLTHPAVSPPPDGTAPSPIVIQAVIPQDRVLLNTSSYRLAPDRPETVPLFLYNFGTNAAHGTLTAAAPEGWRVEISGGVDLAPMERREIPMMVGARGRVSLEGLGRVLVDGDFGAAGRPLLSLRLQPARTNTVPLKQRLLPAADDPARWRSFVSGNGRASLSRSESWVAAEASPATDNRWYYPQFALRPEERLSEDFNAIGFQFELLEGAGQFRVILEEENGSSYMVDFESPPKPGQPVDAVVHLDAADWGATWSLPDPNSHLDTPLVKAVRIGCNTTAGHLRFRVKNLRWLRL